MEVDLGILQPAQSAAISISNTISRDRHLGCLSDERMIGSPTWYTICLSSGEWRVQKLMLSFHKYVVRAPIERSLHKDESSLNNINSAPKLFP